jgi:CRISPR-associated protein Csm4
MELMSPLGTPWQADTLMGHLAWCALRINGESGLKDFLQPFLENDPNFILSDGFPEGYLPRPTVPFTTPNIRESIDEMSQKKRVRRTTLLSCDAFKALLCGDDTEPVGKENLFHVVETIHAVMDRRTETTAGEGNIYSSEDTVLNSKTRIISIYIRLKPNYVEKFLELIRYLSQVGYGRDKSTGLGQFRIVGFEPFDNFANFPEADGFISLSSFVPATSDPADGFWQIRIKRGKLGENTGRGNPFKKPFIQLIPGSLFRTLQHPAPYYGRVLRDLAPGEPRAVQICYCLAVPCKFPNIAG